MKPLDISCSERRGDSVTLTARYDDKAFTNRLQITRASSRGKFVEEVLQRWPAVDPEALQTELERLAASYADEAAQPRKSAGADGAEFDASQVVRPERFITRDVNGVAIPVLRATSEGRPRGVWQLYLAWSDGRREAIDLPPKLDVTDDTALWFHPALGEPPLATVNALGAWSRRGREHWLTASGDAGPADVFARLCERITYFVDLPGEEAAGTAATLALWIMLSYGYPAWSAVPYLYVGGPLGSGKSRLFEVLSRLVFRPLASSSLTGPALFRTLDQQGGTVLLDEAERLREKGPEAMELRSMLLAGYRCEGQAIRLEPVGDTFKPVHFEVYGPKALACISELPPALRSRCIGITMFRAGPDGNRSATTSLTWP